MKDVNFLGLIAIICCLSIINSLHRATNYKDQMKEIQELKILIEQRTYLDSLYWDHLEKCSFIHKDSIGVRRDGTLYDKYQRRWLP